MDERRRSEGEEEEEEVKEGSGREKEWKLVFRKGKWLARRCTLLDPLSRLSLSLLGHGKR